MTEYSSSYVEEFRWLEREARDQKRGLWREPCLVALPAVTLERYESHPSHLTGGARQGTSAPQRPALFARLSRSQPHVLCDHIGCCARLVVIEVLDSGIQQGAKVL